MTIPISPKVSVPICIEQGSVYIYRLNTINRDGTIYNGDRFMIVLNTNPKTDTILILTTITTQIENKKRYIKAVGESSETLVNITKSDFPRLKQDSVVNCNSIYETSLSELISKIENGGKIFSEKLPKSVINALISGVLKSRQVSPEYKKLII